MSETYAVGNRLSYDSALCTVRYVGDIPGTSGTWLGVEWDDQARGKHDGSHKGVRYFTCLSRSQTAASFVRPTRRSDPPQSFLSALHEKYASDTGQYAGGPDAQIVTFGGGKVAQEMGFDKIRKKQSRLEDLKFVILDGMRIARARDESDGRIAETCPSVTQLNLSRSLWESIGGVVEVCGELPNLRKLALSGNRFQDISTKSLEGAQKAFDGITELALEDTLLGWHDICQIAGSCPSLTSLNAGSNYLSKLSSLSYSTLTTTLTHLILEFNDFTSLADLSSITALTALRNLYLKGNNITSISSADSETPIFPPSIQYLDVSYNSIEEWSFVDSLPHHFPNLTGLRLSHNPVYDITGGHSDANKGATSEDAHMFTIARVSSLNSLNFTPITPSDRANAEMFYLSRIAKHLASVPESAEESVTSQHPRYAELCKIYGAPDIIRREEVNPAFLEARLVSVTFYHAKQDARRTSKIPKSFDVYSVKGIAGKLFGLRPLGLRLIWETGEWDPVAGFYEGDGDSSENELEADEVSDGQFSSQEKQTEGKPGRWVKREVELRDGPRQLGYCVDGLDVTIRVEDV